MLHLRAKIIKIFISLANIIGKLEHGYPFGTKYTFSRSFCRMKRFRFFFRISFNGSFSLLKQKTLVGNNSVEWSFALMVKIYRVVIKNINCFRYSLLPQPFSKSPLPYFNIYWLNLCYHEGYCPCWNLPTFKTLFPRLFKQKA